MYEAMMADLAADYYVLAPDLPGFGQSDCLQVSPKVNAISAWADVVAEFYDGPVAGIFGHHTGAAVATELLFRHPEFASRLMLSGPTLLNQTLKNILPEKARSFPPTKDGLHVLGMWQRMQAKDSAAGLDLVLREAQLGLAMGERYPDAYKAVIEHDYQGAISGIRQPVLMFAGTADPLFSVLDDAFACVHSGVKTTIADTASWVCDRQPQVVCQFIRRFMAMDIAVNSKVEWACES
jgi:haloalkane dehalogenase